jgi:type IV pilus assembly protein PilM
MALNISNPLPKLVARWTDAVAGSRRNRRTSVTALDIEDGWLHVVYAAARGGQTRIVRHAAVSLISKDGVAPEDAVARGEAVGRALEQLQLKPGPVVMGVPRAQVMLRRLDLPPAKKPAEIASMVHFQVSRDLPFRLEEALLDFKVLPESHGVAALPDSPSPTGVPGEPVTPPAAPTKVMAAVVRRETVEHYRTLASAAGLKLVGLGLRSVAGTRAVELCHRETSGGCVGLVSIREGEVIFDVLWERALVFSRVGTLPAGHGAEEAAADGSAATASEPVVLEVVRCLHSYESAEGHQRVARFFVTGPTGAETEIAAALGERFGVPAQVLDPRAALAEADGDKNRAAGALPAIGLGLEALDPAGLSFDFLNPKRPPVQHDYRRVRTFGAVAGSLGVFLAVVGLRAHWIHQRERQRATVREEIAVARKALPAYR